MPETRNLIRIRLFIAVLALVLLNVLGLYWSRSTPARQASLQSQARCEAIFGLMDSLPTLPQFQKPLSLKANETPGLWMTRAMEIMDPYRVLFLQKEVHRSVREAQENWASFTEDHDCAWFSEWVRPLWNQSAKRLWAEIARQHNAYGRIRIGVKKELSVSRPMHFALSETEWSNRVISFATTILNASDDKLMKAFRGNRAQYVKFTLEELAVPTFVEPETLLTKAYLSAKDPFSAYFSASEFADFAQELSGETVGIGIQAVRSPEGLWIQKVLPKTPAAKVLKEQDTITHIEGVQIGALTSALSRRLLAGKEGSALQITYCRPKMGCRAAQLVRQKFTPDEAKIEYELRDAGNGSTDKVAMITIPSFYGKGSESPAERSSADDLEAILHELNLKQQRRQLHLAGVVLDLRGNPGGYLEEAIQMASLFLGTKPVVGLREVKNSRVHWGSKHEALYQGPLVALVDRLSASAAEVLAGSLKDHRRAVLIGSDHTYGKGTVQKLIPLSEVALKGPATNVFDGAAIKLTTSVFYSPKGHTPASHGVKTDIVLKSALNEGGVQSDFMNPPHFADSKPFSRDGKVLVEETSSDDNDTSPLLVSQIDALRQITRQKRVVDVKKALEERQADEAVEITQELSRILNGTPLIGAAAKAPSLSGTPPSLRGH